MKSIVKLNQWQIYTTVSVVFLGLFPTFATTSPLPLVELILQRSQNSISETNHPKSAFGTESTSQITLGKQYSNDNKTYYFGFTSLSVFGEKQILESTHQNLKQAIIHFSIRWNSLAPIYFINFPLSPPENILSNSLQITGLTSDDLSAIETLSKKSVFWEISAKKSMDGNIHAKIVHFPIHLKVTESIEFYENGLPIRASNVTHPSGSTQKAEASTYAEAIRKVLKSQL